MCVSPAECLGLKLRAHELLQGVPLYDVSVVDLKRTLHPSPSPGHGDDRLPPPENRVSRGHSRPVQGINLHAPDRDCGCLRAR
jgi:hypothetical protein